jgi:hypothetical protein
MNRVSYGLSREQQKIREQVQACHQTLVELEERAGIAKAAEEIRNELPWYFEIYDAEQYSDKRRELAAFETQMQQDRASRRLRKLYFEVHDIDLRKGLIAKEREEGDLALRFFEAEVDDASRRCRAAQSTGTNWWVWASVWGVVLIGIGFHLFGIIGALGGLLVGYFSGRSIEQSALQARQTAVAEAEREMQEAKQHWDKVRNEPQTFSRREAISGEPDQDDRRTMAS